MNSLVTFESVAAAAQALLDAGQNPSVRKVIASLGGGSPNAVTTLLAEWRAGRPTVSAETLTVNDALLSEIRKQMKLAADSAAAAAEQRASDSEETLALVREELNAETHKASALQTAVDDMSAELTSLKKDADMSHDELVKTRQDLDAARVTADSRLSELSKLQTQKDGLNDAVKRLTDELERTSKALSETQKRATDAEQSAATAAAKTELLNARIADGQAQISGLKESLADAQARFDADKTAFEKRLSEAESRHATALEKAAAATSLALQEKATLQGRLSALEEQLAAARANTGHAEVAQKS